MHYQTPSDNGIIYNYELNEKTKLQIIAFKKHGK